WPRKLSQHALSSSSMQGKGVFSDDDFTTASHQGEKPAASDNQTRDACTGNRAGHGSGRTGIHRSGVASLTAEYVGNEDVPKIIHSGQVGNRRVSNAEDEVAGDPEIPVSAGFSADPETESPCAVPVEGSGVCLQRLSCKRLSDTDVPYHNASSVEFEELEVRRPRLRPSNGIRWAIRQIHHEIHIRPNLGDVHSAKRRGTTTARAVVRCQIENDGMTG